MKSRVAVMIDAALPIQLFKRGHDDLARGRPDIGVRDDARHDSFKRKAMGENHALQVDKALFDALRHGDNLSSVSGSTTIAEAGGVTSLARGGCSILCACNACENPFRPGAA